MSTLRAGFALVALTILTINAANAALLTGSVAPPPGSVDLTTQGNTDWIHWGLNNVNDVNRKLTGLSQISNFTKIGTGTNVVRLTDSPSKYSWIDGSPTAVVTNTPGGVYINNFDGPGRGFQFTVPADIIEHTLFVHLGEFSATGTLTASLNDGSGLTYTQALNGAANQTVQGVYTIDFQANAPASTLTVRWVETAELGTPATNADNITLQAVALCTPPVVPEPATALAFFSAAALFLARRR
jgi:hypothetical protein